MDKMKPRHSYQFPINDKLKIQMAKLDEILDYRKPANYEEVD